MAEGVRAQEWKRELVTVISESEQRHESQRSNPWGRSTYLELQFPHFDGEGLDGWLLKAECFFELCNVAMENKDKVAALHFEGKALQWHQFFVKVKGVEACGDWQEYVRALNARFGSHFYYDPLSELRNLKQVGTIEEYLDAFDELFAKVDIREDQAISFFLSGLIDELQMPVRMFKPRF